MTMVTFSSVAEGWLKSIEQNVSKNTYSIYCGYVKNYMLPYIDIDDVDDVNQHIEVYITKIERNERAELVKKFYPVLSMILDYAVAQGHIAFNYARVNAPFAKDEGLSYADIGIDELSAILSQAKHDEMLLDFVLILDCGLSRGEILGLKWSDVDVENKSLAVNRMVVARSGATVIAEADKKRVISIMDITSDLLAEKRGDGDSFLIPSPSGATTPFNPSAYRKKIDRVIKKALNGDSVTIEVLGYVLSIIKDFSRGAAERDSVLEYALEKSKSHVAVENKYRKAGTGYVSQLSPSCWQGRYTPTIDGKRVSKNVYAATEEECERKLAELIERVKEKRS